MPTTHSTVEIVNNILQGEISAAETYVQAEQKFEGEPERAELTRLKGDHIEACNALRRHVHAQGAQPATDSGVWGAWAKAVEGTAKVFGKTAALKALKEGEEHGVRHYRDALQDGGLDAQARGLIESELLPKTERHIQALDRLMHLESASSGTIDR